MAHPGNNLINFKSRQLSPLTRLGTLGHLDLQFFGIDQVTDADPEAGRGYLFDFAVFGVAIGLRNITVFVFAPFA